MVMSFLLENEESGEEASTSAFSEQDYSDLFSSLDILDKGLISLNDFYAFIKGELLASD